MQRNHIVLVLALSAGLAFAPWAIRTKGAEASHAHSQNDGQHIVYLHDSPSSTMQPPMGVAERRASTSSILTTMGAPHRSTIFKGVSGC